MKVKMEFDTEKTVGWKVSEDGHELFHPKDGSEIAAYIVILHHDSYLPIVARYHGKAPDLQKLQEALIPDTPRIEDGLEVVVECKECHGTYGINHGDYDRLHLPYLCPTCIAEEKRLKKASDQLRGR